MTTEDMVEPLTDSRIGLSPLSRLHLEATEHFKIAPAAIYDTKYADKLVERIQQTDTKLEALYRNCGKFTFFLLLTIATGIKGVTFFGYSLASLSFVIEALLLGSALGFFFLCSTFATSQGYKTMLRAWCSVKDPIDIENLVASYHTDDMIIRMFRAKSNLNETYRTDFFKPRKSFRIVSVVVHIAMLLVMLSLMAIYFLIQFLGMLGSYVDHPLGYWPTVTILATCVLAHLIGIALIALCYVEFSFDIQFAPFKNRQ